MDAKAAPWPALGVAAKGIVQRGDGAILLLRRSAGSRVDPGRWELPGGKMDFGERILDALVREVREETGLEIRDPRPLHVANFEKPPLWVTSVAFVCTAVGGDVILSREHDAFEWVAPEDVGTRPLARAAVEQIAAFLGRTPDAIEGTGARGGPGGGTRSGGRP